MKSDAAVVLGAERFIPVPARGEGFDQERIRLLLQSEALGVFIHLNVCADSVYLFSNSFDPA
jgi:hypothetical protein